MDISIRLLMTRAGFLPLEQVIQESGSYQDGSLLSNLESDIPLLLSYPVDHNAGAMWEGHKY